MLSFKQFNEERKVDPEKLAVRIAKKYGKKERYGKWLTAEKGKHVPLKSYRSKEAESVFNKFDRVARKHPDYGKKHGAVDHLFSHKKMEIKHFSPTQPFVRTDNPETLKKKIHGSSEGKVAIATHKGKHYILDGHHRVFAAALRGEKHIVVDHINLDEH
jgi:hypothetical protein